MSNYVITIDGTTASGKSTLGRWLAFKLHCKYVETGLMYRALTWGVLNQNIQDHVESIVNLASTAIIKLDTLSSAEQVSHIWFNDTDITAFIRQKEIDDLVSHIASLQEVRKVFLDSQRDLLRESSSVVVGRDAGTTIAPEADIKFFLKADIGVRTQRYQKELRNLGQISSLSETKSRIEKRDNLDSSRDSSPLQKADDAIVIDTTTSSIKQVREFALIHIANQLDFDIKEDI